MTARFRERAAAVRRRGMPPVEGPERRRIIEQMELDHAAAWTVVVRWDPESRYGKIGMWKQLETAEMLDCVERLLEVL